MRITSASDGDCPTAARISCASVAWFSHAATNRFGRVPSDLRPTAPDRRICTNVRSMRPLSITRGKARASMTVSTIESAASNSAGISFIWPCWRAWIAACARNFGSTWLARPSTSSSCASALA